MTERRFAQNARAPKIAAPIKAAAPEEPVRAAALRVDVGAAEDAVDGEPVPVVVAVTDPVFLESGKKRKKRMIRNFDLDWQSRPGTSAVEAWEAVSTSNPLQVPRGDLEH